MVLHQAHHNISHTNTVTPVPTTEPNHITEPGVTVNFTEPTSTTNPILNQRVDHVEIVKKQLDTLRELVEGPEVQSLLLTHVKGTLDKLIRQCQAVSVSTPVPPPSMEITDKVGPNQRLSHITKMKKKKKKEKSQKKVENKKFDWTKTKASLCLEPLVQSSSENPCDEPQSSAVVSQNPAGISMPLVRLAGQVVSKNPAGISMPLVRHAAPAVPVVSRNPVSCSLLQIQKKHAPCNLIG